MYKVNYIRPLLCLLLFCFLLACSESSPSDDSLPTPSQEEEIDNEDSEEENNQNETEDDSQNDTEEEDTSEPNENPDNDEDGNAEAPENRIELSGDETSKVGNELIVGHIAVGLTQVTGNERTVILSDILTPIGEDGPEPEDVENNFIIVCLDLGDQATEQADRALSINISVDGTDYKYACASPSVGTFIDCGDDFEIDFEQKVIVFKETTVVNTDNNNMITLSGTVEWTD
ncbi:hypothetical protein [Cytophaga sp. FL35]|uniref:hypothetical protein n=1 Tax=Cytophaga sp. FL35 TaxID=1904456 RepID=UPI001653EB6B|nr:hypothetical protein [Cytophaga sp. FL35]MBC6999940.1 hypothetical protein [Cytophaga sp. FL35]